MDARLLDEIATAATEAETDEQVHGWWCKASPHVPFRRSNCVLPALGAGADRTRFDAALADVRAWYQDRGLRLIVQVSTADPDHEQLDAWLAAEGLEVEAPVHLMTSGPAPASGRSAAEVDAPAAVRVQAGIDETWAHQFGRLHGGDATQRDRTAAYGRMLHAFGDRALGASCERDGTVVGLGLGVLDRGWLGIFGMATSPDHRRQGIATDVVGALRAAAAARGAEHAYLQVEVDNAAAIACYQGLGFQRHHGYHYRSQGVDRSMGC